ncbi:MAG: D-2-hydroxyacid dehydrogenase [Vicinamibacterales bacterium]
MNVLVSIQQPVRAWQIPQGAVASLRERFPHVTFVHAVDAEQRADGLPACEVAYTWILSAAELARAPRLRWVHTSAVAVETLCLPELFARGVLVSNTRGVQATPIAEHVFATVLALAKQLPFALEQQRHARWAQNEFAGDRLPWLLRGRTLGLIGVGTIGGEIARLARAFGMTVIATRRRPEQADVAAIAEVLPASALDALLVRADVLVVAAPLTPETDGLVGAAQIARMKRGSVLVNVGRARIIQTAALVDALHAGHLAGASLDVYPQEPLPPDHPLWTCPNIILTPHTSGFRHGHWEEVVELFADNLMRFEKGEGLRYRVVPELGY